jgi:hypothetical protein
VDVRHLCFPRWSNVRQRTNTSGSARTLKRLFSSTSPLYFDTVTVSKTANRFPLSGTCVHGIGFTNFPDTVANENLDKGKVAGPTAGRCDCDDDDDWGDMKQYEGTHKMRNE